MNYLFQCAIGPVQEFIATARRSRDLWYGSWLLSELSKAAAKSVIDGGGKLIFPFTDDTARDLAAGSQFNAPNKIAAVIDSPPEAAASGVEAALRARLHELSQNAFKKPKGHRLFNQALANSQIDDLIELYWVSVPLDDDGEYPEARRKAEALLDARKATRDFSTVSGAWAPKSSLDGARESVIAEAAYTGTSDSAQVLFERFGARPAERLSGVDILKRLGEYRGNEPDFHSTSYMAALPFLSHIDNNRIAGNSQQLLASLHGLFLKHNVPIEEDDAALVFVSRLADWIPDDVERAAVADKVESILDTYADKVRPQPYYALLAADGDNMGATIDYLTTQPNPQQNHRDLSTALSKFAYNVAVIVEENLGVLVYSGGDDILAYLPLHTVLQCADQLAEAFADAMSAYRTDRGVSPTLSTGIVVAHHIEPLSDTLNMARDAERKAKTVESKHGLAVTVNKRSGAERTIVGKRTELSPRLQQMIEWRKSGAISAGAAYQLQELSRLMTHMPHEAVTAEALRIIERKRETGGRSAADASIKQAVKNWLSDTQGNQSTTDQRITLAELAQELIVVKVFADAHSMAEGGPEEVPDDSLVD